MKSGVISTVLLLLLLCAGCTFHQFHQSESVRAKSVQPYANRKIGAVEIGDFLRSRVALLASSDAPSELQVTNGFVRIPPESNLGCAVAIDPRGYYLTAAHCLAHAVIYLFVPVGKTVAVLPARIVWRGGSHGQPDLAILHVPKTLEHTFDWAGEVQTDEAVMAVGLSWSKSKFSGFELVGGQILSCRKSKSEVGELLVVSDLPLQSGDSGGPLVDLDGYLIGINVQGTPPVLGKWLLRSYAERPNQQRLEKLIEADVAAQRAEAVNSSHL